MSAGADFRAADFAHPIFDPYRAALERLHADAARWPDCERLNGLARELGIEPRTASGKPVRFAVPRPDTPGYEILIHDTGCVPTRSGNWHDLFNALAWLAFPRTKAALNAVHVAQIPLEHGRRGAVRDLLTLLDEGGVLVACSQARLAELVREFRWSELFWQRRSDVLSHLRLAVLGHAVLEKALVPWPGATCKALFIEVDPAVLHAGTRGLVQHLDEEAARWIAARAPGATPRTLPPLPVFGYPDWFPGNDSESFYADTRYFRPARPAAGQNSQGPGTAQE